METSGARLREIGTTNRTRPADYEQAVDDDAGALLKVHTSNFRVEGFTRSVTVAELAAIGRRHRLPVIYDTGSGVLAPSVPGGIPGDEPSAAESIEHGADVVLFSGDKVLGGPQAGIIVGRADLVARIEAHPLTRAMRVDKVRLAALAATLRLHRDPAHAARVMPVLRQLAWPVDELERRARAIAAALAGADATVEVVSSRAYLGGGSVPAQAVPGVAVAVRPRSLPDHELARRLRAGSPAVVARVADGAVRLELRSVFPEQDERLAAAVEAALC
jgi:L-seryl-tRNA(Ser) seleniumtransferase